MNPAELTGSTTAKSSILRSAPPGTANPTNAPLASRTVGVSPSDPGEPVGPVGPIEPGVPGAPADPGAPGAPAAPVGPADPPGPVAPIAPGIPGAPGDPGVPRSPGAPVGPGTPAVPWAGRPNAVRSTMRSRFLQKSRALITWFGVSQSTRASAAAAQDNSIIATMAKRRRTTPERGIRRPISISLPKLPRNSAPRAMQGPPRADVGRPRPRLLRRRPLGSPRAGERPSPTRSGPR